MNASDLLQEHHLLRIHEPTGPDAVEIDAGGDNGAAVGAAVPFHSVCPGRVSTVGEASPLTTNFPPLESGFRDLSVDPPFFHATGRVLHARQKLATANSNGVVEDSGVD